MLGQATHCIHHLAPSVPYYRYFRVWNISKEIFEPSIPTRSLWRAPETTQLSEIEDQISESDPLDNKNFEVEIASSGEVLQVGPDETLIDVLHENGYPVMCSCTQGVCGSCLTPVLDGIPEHRDVILSDADKAKNDCMTVCVSRAQGERIVLDL